MACSRCARKMDEGWLFCPMCGARKGAGADEIMGRDFFSQLLSGFKEGMGQGGSAFPGFPEASGKRAGFAGPVRVQIRTAGKGPARPPAGRVMDGLGRPAGSVPQEGGPTREAVEPEARVVTEQGKTFVEVSVPGVKGPGDVTIKELESSLELRALSGEKLYFKVLGKPPSARISGVSFSDGLLKIRF